MQRYNSAKRLIGSMNFFIKTMNTMNFYAVPSSIKKEISGMPIS